jgi:hypothetical protein
MESIYNGARIETIASEDPGCGGWTCEILVYLPLRDHSTLIKRASVSRRNYATQAEAETEAILFARQWIDDGTPNRYSGLNYLSCGPRS